MVSALLDELPCLIDEADQLMARFSWHMIQLKSKFKGSTSSDDPNHQSEREDTTRQTLSPRQSRSKSETTNMDSILKFFERQYLTMQSTSYEKINSTLPDAEYERRALYTVVTSIYQVLKRLHHWQQAAWESLTRFSIDNNSASCLITFSSHPHLTRLVLAIVAKYVKVNLLWTSFRMIPGCLALYSFLHHAETARDSAAVYSPLEHTDHQVREFVLHFGTAPLLAIQQDFQLQVADKGASLAALALSCFERFEACRDLAKLRHQGVFDLESLVSGVYASHSSLPDLRSASDVADWVICVVLCVPHQLQTEDRTGSLSSSSPPSTSFQLWDFMEILARDRLVLTLHRNHVVNLHDLLYQQVTSSLCTALGSRSSVPLKKTMKALSKFALRNCGVNHRQRREVATWLVRACEQLIQHNPGLVAPSFPLLLAALAIANDEIEWVLNHGFRQSPLLPSHVKAKHLPRVMASFSGFEKDLADLLTSSHRLRRLVEQHSHFLAGYYQEFLLNGDAQGIAHTIQELLADASRTELQALLEGFLDTERYYVNASSRVTWVREWRQANSHLAQVPLLDALRTRMERAVLHTQFICLHSNLIEHAANFSKCWWFQDVFDQSFEQTLTTAPPSALGLLEILSSLAAGCYVLDELVDTEEATEHSERMRKRLDRMQTSLVTQIERGLEATVKRDVKLQRDEGSAPQEDKLEPVENKVTASRRLSSFSRVQSSQLLRPASPTASVLTRSDSNPPVSVKPEGNNIEERCLELVRALAVHFQHYQGDSIKAALVKRVEASFVRFLRGFVVISSLKTTEGVTLRYSCRDACEHVRCFLRATQRLFGCSTNELNGIDSVWLGDAVQAVLAKALADECSDETSVLPQNKALLDWTTDSFDRWSLLDRVSWLFVSLVTRKCHFSSSSMPSVLAAVSKHCFVFAPGATDTLDPREYTDPAALQHLTTLIGSTGVEAVCSTVANLVVAQTLKLRSSIEAEHAALAFMGMAISEGPSADVILATAQARALDDIASQLVQIGTTAFLLQLIHRHTTHKASNAWNLRVDPQLERELQDPDRRAAWTRLLPVACSAAFHSSVWKRTTYVASVEATDTNAHLMGIAMAKLLPSPHSSNAVHRCAVTALKRASTLPDGAVLATAKRPTTSETRPLLEALELLVTTAALTSGEASGEFELCLERLLPRVVLSLHSTA